MAHTIVMVPEGHTVQVHPPGMLGQPPGMMADPLAAGGKAAMDAVMPKPKEEPAKVKGKLNPKKPRVKAEGNKPAVEGKKG